MCTPLYEEINFVTDVLNCSDKAKETEGDFGADQSCEMIFN